MTVLLVLFIVQVPCIYKMMVTATPIKNKQKSLEKNIAIKSLAKILFIAGSKRTKTEKEIWAMIESSNRILRDRVYDEYNILSGRTGGQKALED